MPEHEHEWEHNLATYQTECATCGAIGLTDEQILALGGQW